MLRPGFPTWTGLGRELTRETAGLQPIGVETDSQLEGGDIMGNTEARLAAMGIKVPERDLSGSGLIPVRQDGDLLYVSGHGCETEEGRLIYTGKVGSDLTVRQGYEAARQCGLNILATLKCYLGDLDRVEKVIKVLGFVASAPDFYEQPAVMNGFSDLMVRAFGNRGQHARSAIGVAVLPNNQPVEVEVLVRVVSSRC